jgi:hypothetical protein
MPAEASHHPPGSEGPRQSACGVSEHPITGRGVYRDETVQKSQYDLSGAVRIRAWPESQHHLPPQRRAPEGR